MVRLFHLNASDLAHSLSYAPDARLTRAVAAPLAFLCILGGLVAGFFGWSTWLLNLAALYLIAERLCPELKALDGAAAVCGPENTRRVSLDLEHVVFDQRPGSFRVAEASSTSYRWEQLSAYYSCPKCLVLLCPNREPQLLPKIWFSAIEYALLSDLLARKVTRQSRRWWRALRPLLVLGAVLGSWLCWVAPL